MADARTPKAKAASRLDGGGGPAGPVIGLALGSGSARGWAHIGVLRELEQAGIRPHVIAGTSIGAFVGAAYAAGVIEPLEEWVDALGWKEVLGFFDVTLSGGLLKGNRLMSFFGERFVATDFSGLQLPFACVATDLSTGREVWLRDGSVAEAVRASTAIPGLFAPVPRGSSFLMDGALVNPVPVSLCRALGADIVIAVDLGSELVRERHRRRRAEQAETPRVEGGNGWTDLLRRWWSPGEDAERGVPLPSMVDVLTTSINIMQVRISRSRMAGEPADLVIAPRLADIGLMDYHRGKELIDEGRSEARLMLPAVRRLLEE